MKTTNEQLIDVFKETLDCIKVGGYESPSGNWIELTNPLQGTKFYLTLPTLKEKSEKQFNSTKIYVENIDTFQKAQKMGSDCAVLNMASFVKPGGGVMNGSRAQEEDLCRRSNLVQSLFAYGESECKELGYKPPKRLHYPLPLYGGIYSPNVMVFRSAQSYNFMDNPFTCSVISVAGVRRPELDKKTGMMVEKAAVMMKGKIRAILRIAILEGHSKLVLGALSCGAYSAPAKHVSQLFREVLDEKEFQNVFEEICFAILEDHNSIRNNNPGNVKPFKEVFPD